MVTRVENYTPGGIIHDLPIINVNEWRANSEMVGVGRVKNSGLVVGEKFYKPVLVFGAADDKGRFIRRAEIVENMDTLILARKVS